jgi:hypothetical protein
MTDATLPGLHQAFNAAFIVPVASHVWESESGRAHWVNLEAWQDAIAGPLLAIAKSGSCEYVYARDDWYFVGINKPAELRSRLLEWHSELKAGIGQFVPISLAEAADLAYMQSLIDQMHLLIASACDVEQNRRDATRHV